MAQSAPDAAESLFLFDFDGVVCDSCDECTVSALRTCQKLDTIEDDDAKQLDNPPQWLFEKMREIRPAIEVGWQIPVLLSVFVDQRAEIPDILANYQKFLNEWLDRYGKTDKDMIKAFGDVRDKWIADHLSSWLDINTFYPGVPEALSSCRGKSVLVTTKQHRFAVALCRHAGVSEEALSEDDIYGLGMYKSKADVIVDRMKQDHISATNTRFFEDRWPTLAKCLLDPRLDGVRFFLCSWGYVTTEELKLAEAEPRVEVIGLGDFARIVS